MNKEDEERMQTELAEKYDKMRRDYEHQQQEIMSLQDARNKKLNLFEHVDEN